MVVGTKITRNKEILGIYLGNEDENKNIINDLYKNDIAEATSFWTTIFEDLKERGIEEVFCGGSDGLIGIITAVKNSFKNAYYQRCVVHLVRNLKDYANKKNCKEFLEKYENDKTLIKHFKEYMEYIFSLFDISINIRKYIYTNNIVELVNSKIKRGFYGRGDFLILILHLI